MDMNKLKLRYEELLYPIFMELLCIDDSEESKNWIAIALDGNEGDFHLSLYGLDCVHLHWCGECFIFDKKRDSLVSSDTYGEIVYEGAFTIEQLPLLVTDLILHIKDCILVSKEELIRGKTPSLFDDIKDYIITTHSSNIKLPMCQHHS